MLHRPVEATGVKQTFNQAESGFVKGGYRPRAAATNTPRLVLHPVTSSGLPEIRARSPFHDLEFRVRSCRSLADTVTNV
jgi:hypothetical protein